MSALLTLVCVIASSLCAVAQYPSTPVGITTLQSKLQPGVEITYKETHLCETTPGVKSYSGYVHLPSSVLGDVGNYNISTFFWYFEARHHPKTAPLSIYLAGGPGEPSTYAVLSSESGPCFANLDGNSTTINPWSFNNHVNMLYIDQPAQTGFSYSSLINATYNSATGSIVLADPAKEAPAQNTTFLAGTFASQDPLTTANNSITSAKALWHFAEIWLAEFPHHTSNDKRISVWGNSYGGYWVPAVVAYFDRKLKDLKSDHALHGFEMDTLGITNGCVDMLISTPSYPAYAHNNTYGLQLFSESMYRETSYNFTKPGGCRDLITECRALGEQGDPCWIGDNSTVNQACDAATQYCYANVVGDLGAVANRNNFDIAVGTPDPCLVYLPLFNFLNKPWVQEALGVPLNFTLASSIVADYSLDFSSTYIGTGDPFRRTIAEFEYVLQHDIKVAMAFGDRDYRCTWLGGEATALAAKYQHSKQFAVSGYETMVTNQTYNGGVVRQHGKFSFARVFEAGHSVSAYQPETVYRIFMRAMFDQDIATGTKSRVGYQSTGPTSSFNIKNVLPPAPSTCMIEGEYQSQALNLGGRR